MGFTLAAINEALAAVLADRECIVFRDRRLTWREFGERTRRLANALGDRGLGCRRERGALQPHESGQDHLGLYLHNGNAYLEGMIGAFKARVAPFNVNYRYVEDELVYLFRDAAPRGLVYHATFAPVLARVRDRIPPLAALFQVADDSGNDLLAGAVDYETALAAASPARPAAEWSPDDLYVLYTGGTTGMPKGVLWRQEDIFFAAMGGRPATGAPVESMEALVAAAEQGAVRGLAAPPFMHGAAQWMAFTVLHQGGTVVVQAHPERFDPHELWQTIECERVTFLTIVGDAFARPMVDALDERRYDLSSLHVVLSGGAILTPALKAALLERLPHIMILDGFGASETGGHGSQLTVAGEEAVSGTFRMDDSTVVLAEDLGRVLEPGADEIGWLARRGHVPLGYLGDPEKTAKTFPRIGGVRYAVPGDHAQVRADGTIVVLGRGSVSINTGGEKVYPEEVERALKHHPAVYDAVVVGTPHAQWGEQVTALVQARPGPRPTPEELIELCARTLARFKLPKVVIFVEAVVRSPSGKPDYRWAKTQALARLGHGRASPAEPLA
jgi:fatty-acyl-CoA synthase